MRCRENYPRSFISRIAKEFFDRSSRTKHRYVQYLIFERRLLHNRITKKAENSISFYQEVAILKEKKFLQTEVTDKRIDTPLSVWGWLAFNFHQFFVLAKSINVETLKRHIVQIFIIYFNITFNILYVNRENAQKINKKTCKYNCRHKYNCEMLIMLLCIMLKLYANWIKMY